MQRFLFFLVILFCTSSFVFSQADRNTRYVAVQSIALKASAGSFASETGTVSFGDAVTLIREDGRWSQVRAGNITGWTVSTNLSSRRVVASNASTVTASEVALAGKGFSPETEMEYRRNGLDFSLVDSMEQTAVSQNDLLRFINDGRLLKGE
jgi:uncharacterized protein YgiM (DUF1202 family)